MKKAIVLVIIIAAFVGLFALIYFGGRKSPGKGIIYYYAVQCPHCVKVDAFMKKQKVASKVNFVKKDVLQNRDYLNELLKTMKYCRIPIKRYIIIPVLWTGSKCIRGQQNIIDFFKEQMR